LVKIVNVPAEGKRRLVFCKAYRHYWTKKLMVASAYGYQAWAFYVKDME